jgi:hypothetical protein
LLAEKVRSHLTDEKRLVRVYGSDVVIARLLGDNRSARLYLINYGAQMGAVPAIRVRVLGRYESQVARQFGEPRTNLQDVSVDADATEFTLPELRTFAIIDLNRRI